MQKLWLLIRYNRLKFSIITPSRLANYNGAARFREQKIIRAVSSVLNQTFLDFELIVIADGCERTKQIISTYISDERVKLLECKHKALFDNTPRNTGIEAAQGEYIIYIDIDDYWGEEHLAIINHNLKDRDWVWFNDYVFNGQWVERACNIKQMGACGTSNVCHARKHGLKWERPGYAHDFYFNQKLLKFRNGTKIETPEYFVLHIPGKGGYDL